MIAIVPPGARVLEVGCGCGLFLGLAAACGLCVRGLGIDSSGTAIHTASLVARRIAAETDWELRFERRRAQEPLPDGEFDLVALIDVVHHLPPAAQEDAVRRAASRVRAGGTFLYKDMCERPSWRAWANRLHGLLSYRQWIYYAPTCDVASWIRDRRARADACSTYQPILLRSRSARFSAPKPNGIIDPSATILGSFRDGINQSWYSIILEVKNTRPITRRLRLTT